MIIGKTNSEDIFNKLNLALQEFKDKELSCPNNEKILILIYDCKEDCIKVVNREEILELIKSHNYGESDFVILGEVLSDETKTVTDVVKEFITEFNSSSFSFFSKRLTFSEKFQSLDRHNNLTFIKDLVIRKIHLDFARQLSFVGEDWDNYLRSPEQVWLNFLQNKYWKRILNEYYISKINKNIENCNLNFLHYVLQTFSRKFGFYQSRLVNKKFFLFTLEILYLLGTKPNQPHFFETGLGEELIKNPELIESIKKDCKGFLKPSEWKTLIQSVLDEDDNMSYLYQSQKNDFIIFADEFYQFLFKEKNDE